jgi:hypothetical protein
MSRRHKKKKGVSPMLAIGLLVAAVAVAGRTLLGGGADSGLTPATAGTDFDPAAADPEAAGTVAEDAAVRWSDLLAVHGSFRSGREVRLAFSAFEYTSFWAAPAGESGASYGRWTGEDPPLLKLGVVMISAASRRAVLGGRVVGVGDELDSMRVLQIEPGVVYVQWSGRRLTYDLDSDAPREFRGELAQRQSENKDGHEAATTAPVATTPKETSR